MSCDEGAKFVAPGIGGEILPGVPNSCDRLRPTGQCHFGGSKIAAGCDLLPIAIRHRLDAAENVKAGLEPVGKSLRDFERLVHRMVGGLDSVDNAVAAVHGEVGMDLDHRGSRRDQF